jgi:alpha-tubulin suppressor-like RCC1 family protein
VAQSETEQIYLLTSPLASGSSQTFDFTPIGPLAGARKLAVPENGDHLLALTQDGRVWSWTNKTSSQTRQGGTLAVEAWSEVRGTFDMTGIAAGTLHSVALKKDGTVWTWGSNYQGQLGDGTLADRAEARAVEGLSDVQMVAAGGTFTLALRSDGTVLAWGSNWNDIVPGDGRRLLTQPVVVPGLTGVKSIAVYRDRGYAQDGQGRLWVWGTSDRGENSAATQMSEVDAAKLPAPVIRQLGEENQAIALQSDWQSSMVQIAASALEVTKNGVAHRFAFEGAVKDVGWGWGVALITAPGAVQAAGASGRSPVASVSNGTAQKPATAAAVIQPRAVTAAPKGTLTATQTHTIVVNASGTACSVGRNEYGELGDATLVNRSTFVPVVGLNNLLSKVSTGWYHSLGLRTDGTISAWGYNGYGQLGDGTTVDKVTPIHGGGTLTGIVDVAAGQYHSVAVKNDGTIWAWGYNGSGQLGNGTTQNQSLPVQAISIGSAIQVAAGEYHTLALKSDGTVWAWGYNAYGQLGNGTTTNSSTAVQVTGLTNVIRIAAGTYHSMALKNDGTVWTWGYNAYGELGDGGKANSTSIVNVSNLTGAVDIAAGDYHSLAVKSDGTVWAWGFNQYGELGNSSTTSQVNAVQVSQSSGSNFNNIIGVAAGIYYSAALKNDGTLFAWGHNDYGQLGIGNTTDSVIPVQSSACSLTSFSNVTASPFSGRITANQTHSLGVKPDGSVWAWGDNTYGELGDGTTTNRLSPVQAAITGAVTQISTGWYHTLALKSDRSVWAWGYNAEGQIGDGTTNQRATPIQVSSLTGLSAVTGVAAGQYHSVAVKSDGTVWGWGYNAYGQLGDGSTTSRLVPVQAVLLPGVMTQVAAGQTHTLALKNDGTVWAWGYNGYGQLGDGTQTNRTTAVQVVGLTNVIAIAAGPNHSLALKSDGTVWAWGYGYNGQLGDGGSSYATSIVRASGLSNIIAIAAGDYHSLAVRSDGTVWAWGDDVYGELGNASSTASNVPVQALGISGAVTVSAGSYYSMALNQNDGKIWVWGHNSAGQFGIGNTSDSTIPEAGPAGFLTVQIPPSRQQFVPVAPCRIADTRNPTGPFGGPSIPGGTARNFAIPSSSCFIPSTATAYSINVTVVPHGTLTFLTIYPTGQSLPLASTLNSFDGRVKANAAMVPAGVGGSISVFVTDTTDVILDINGYFVTPSSSTLTFFPLPPCRIADTRSANSPLGGPSMFGGQDRTFPVLSSFCNIPSTALAYSLNFTAIPHGLLGFVTTWPTGGAQPLVSTLNASTGQVTANAAIVPAGAGGQIDVFATDTTDLVIDVNGYFAPAGAGGLSFYNVSPCRVLDTRNPPGTLPFTGTESVSVAASLCAPPGNAQAYVFSATVVPPGPLYFLTLWPQGAAQPFVSTLNASDGAVTNNMALVPTSNGSIDAFVANPSQLFLDISGYFAP